MKITWKASFLTTLLAILFTLPTFAQTEEAVYPGDNFSLEGALELFKKSASPEAFEQALNSEDNTVNNLDLNEDGTIDFIRVTDYQEGDVHAIALQVDIDKNETQDIAVIEIEKTGQETAMLQIVGDADVYGEQTIVEPYDEKTIDGGKGGPSVNMETAFVVVNVWAWSPIRFIYGPRYRVYASPFVWNVRPRWYRPWRPRPIHVFRPLTVRYRPFYRITPTHRVVRAHRVYVPRRKYSPVVRTKTTRITTVRNANGKVVGTKKTTTVHGKKGSVQRTTATGKKVNPRTGTVTKKTATTNKATNRRGAAVGQKKTTTVKKKGNVAKKKTTVKRGAKRRGN